MAIRSFSFQDSLVHDCLNLVTTLQEIKVFLCTKRHRKKRRREIRLILMPLFTRRGKELFPTSGWIVLRITTYLDVPCTRRKLSVKNYHTLIISNRFFRSILHGSGTSSGVIGGSDTIGNSSRMTSREVYNFLKYI